MEEITAEATDSLPKDTGGIVGLEGPLDSLDLTNILVKELGEQEQQSEEPSPSGDAVEEVEAVRNQLKRQLKLNTIFHRKNQKRNPKRKPVQVMNRNGFNGGLIALLANYVWRRKSATNWTKKLIR